MRHIFILSLILLILVPFSASAESVVRIGQNISVEANQVVDGDYYVSVGPFGNTSMSGEVKGDMYAFGRALTTNGAIGQDLSILGGSVQMHATVTDDVRIIAGDVTIAEHVGGDLFVIGGVLKILSTATIDGDVIFFGGSSEINGTVKGSVLGTSEFMRVDGHVLKNIDVKTAQSLTLGDTAVIDGYVTYASFKPLVRAQGASIAGEVHQTEYVSNTVGTEKFNRASLIPVFITLFTTLSLYLLFRKELIILIARIHAAPLKNALFGVGLLLLGPIVSIVLMATVLGVLLGILSAAVVTIMFILGFVLAGIVSGSYLAKIFTKHPTVSLPWVVAGTVIIQTLLLFIPIVGVFALVTFFVLAIGGIIVSVYNFLV